MTGVQTCALPIFHDLDLASHTIPIIKTWVDVYHEMMKNYPHIKFSHNVIDSLFPHPFSRHVADRILFLLSILNQIVHETRTDGSLSPLGLSLYCTHFGNEKSLFSDESDTNKNTYRKELFFIDPDDNKTLIFCTWHGKIKTPQIRIHFEWPIPQGQKFLKVVYVGPKITKN